MEQHKSKQPSLQILSIVYFQIPFLRCRELDALFGGVIVYCISLVLRPMVLKKPESSPKVVPMEKQETSPKEESTEITKKCSLVSEPVAEPIAVDKKHNVYNIEFMRNINGLVYSKDSKRDYSIVIKATENYCRTSPTPYRSNYSKNTDPYNYFRKHTPEPNEFVSRSPRGRLDADEEREYNQAMRELTPDFCPMVEKELPLDVKVGRIHWLHQRNGRIHVIEPINGIRDIFFHLRDCELESGDEIKLGDSVMFELALYEGRLCGKKVKKMSTKAIPSPDFSRRILKQSEEVLPKIDALTL